LLDAAEYAWYAREWGWTPEQVDAVELPLLDDMRLAAIAIKKGEARAQERANRAPPSKR